MNTDLPDALIAAWERRQELHHAPELDTYRIFHGFTEGRPGLDIERFGPVARITLKGDDPVDLEAITTTLLALHPFDTIALKRARRKDVNPDALSMEPLHGELPERPVPVVEARLRFEVEPFARDNAGLFLDARPARAWVRKNGKGRRLLNLFAYTGSLGVAGMAGGAAGVVHVDGKQGALDRARRNHELNRQVVDGRSYFKGNVYAHLPRAIKSGVRFDAVILDPPPQMPRLSGSDPQDYTRLARYAGELLSPGGWLLCFFSRYDRTRADYEETVESAVNGTLEVCWRGESGIDFPEDDPDAKLRLTAWARS